MVVAVADGGELPRSSRLSPGGTRIVNKRPIRRKEPDVNNRERKRTRNVEGVVAATPRALNLTNTDDTATNRANERTQNANKRSTEIGGGDNNSNNNDKQHREGKGDET